jgi:ribokinase
MIDILTPNEKEARVLAGHDPRSTIAPQDVARELLRKGVKCVITTLGEKGALLVNESAMVHVPAIQVSAVDTTGAGDAFNAGLATALAFGASLEHAVRFAVIIGGLAVAKEGVIPALPKREDVLSYFRNNGQTPPAWFLSWMQ